MSTTKEKYLSGAKISETPRKKLALVIKDGSVTTGKVADEAITEDKLSEEVRNKIDLRSIVEGAVIVADPDQNPTTDDDSTKETTGITGYLDGTVLKELDKRVSELEDNANLKSLMLPEDYGDVYGSSKIYLTTAEKRAKSGQQVFLAGQSAELVMMEADWIFQKIYERIKAIEEKVGIEDEDINSEEEGVTTAEPTTEEPATTTTTEPA